MKKIFMSMILFILFVSCERHVLHHRIEDFRVSRAVQSERDRYKRNLLDSTIEYKLSLPLNLENESEWDDAFWGMELSLYTSEATHQALKSALSTFEERSLSFQRSLIEVIYCLHPNEFIEDVTRIAMTTTSPKLFAMAVHHLVRNQNDESAWFALMEKRFHPWEGNPILFMLGNDLKISRHERFSNRPPILDLLKHPFQRRAPVIYSFQRSNRDYPGMAVIKKPDGTFVRNSDGNIFSVSQFARSASALPGYITNGNTPQGILSIQGTDVSKLKLIGPSPNLQLVLPVETSVQNYFHQSTVTDTVWTIEKYRALLPDSWKEYFPIYEAFHAGAAGRTEIIAHGTTIDPSFYEGQIYYPNTPSLGCLTAKELWSSVDGQCLYSDQIAFMNAWLSSGGSEGFLIVVELDDKPQPVVLDEVIVDVLRAENP